ncbi:hypothetical protein GC096_18695 [Paenibacillus sp. LMG 31461]|uniref:Uncharacterized protein n=1 Tax=Paenibacillus plantarum TaxID=2654975 RepID=A0ABX1XDN4_9BACL|nr:carbohydrate binding domain-containing protein [Paenibacillus plantarum]NOU66068.1 hypothetical protein [Paenibacillus plantarum]
MLRKVLASLCAVAITIASIGWAPAPAAATARTIVLNDDLHDQSKLYKTSKAVETVTASDAEVPQYAGDRKLLKRTETGTTYVYYKVNGKLKSVSVDMYFRTGLYVPVEFYVSSDDSTYVWAQKYDPPLEDTANGWKKKSYTLNTTYLNQLNASYLRIPIPQNNSNVTYEPLLGNVTITYDTSAGYLHDDASLQQLAIGSQALPGFDPAATSYELALPAGTEIGAATQVYATATDAGYATVSVTQAVYLPGYATVMVTAEDGTTTRTYSVHLTKLPPSGDATLSALTVGGSGVDGFAPGQTEYGLMFPHGTQAGVATAVYATASDLHAGVVIGQVSALPGTATVRVTAEDGTTVREYLVHMVASSGVPGMNNTYYVSKSGSDMLGDGSVSSPWRTIQQAADAVVAGDTVLIREGTYHEQVVVNSSGTEEHPILFASYPGETVTVSGADPIVGWQADAGSVYKADMSWNLQAGNQLFFSGEAIAEARWPNAQPNADLLHPDWATADAGTATTIKDSALTEPDGYWNGAKLMVKSGDGWVLQSSTVTDYKQATGLTFAPLYYNESTFYTPRAGNLYYLYGTRKALDADKEWYYDSVTSTVYMMASGFIPDDSMVEAKVRDYSFVLRGRSNIAITGIRTYAAGLDLKDASSVKLDGMSIKYLSSPLTLSGNDNEISNSTIAYAPGSVIEVTGEGNRIVNNDISDGNYLGTWQGAVRMGGNHNLLSYNTIHDAGRACVEITGKANIIEFNDIYNGGLLTNDTGLLYGGFIDADNTEIRYNWIHDNRAEILAEGIYPDNSSFNYIIHHNVVWNAGAALRLNTPNNYMLVYNNTLIGSTGMYGFIYREDMYGGQFVNNILTGAYNFSADAVRENNIEGSVDPLFVDRTSHDFRLQAGSPARDTGIALPGITDGFAGTAPDIGAYEYGAEWVPGHNFADPPASLYAPSDADYRNRVQKGGFESVATLESPWIKTGAQKASIVFEYATKADKKSRGGNQSVQLGTTPAMTYAPVAVEALEASIIAAQTVESSTYAAPADITAAIVGMNDARSELEKTAPDLLANSGFESGLTIWSSIAAKTEASSTQAYGGSQSLRSFERTAFWAGPYINLPLVNGHTYNVSARVKLGAGTNVVHFVSMPNGVNTPREMANGSITSTAWTQISGRYTMNEAPDFAYGRISFYTQTSLADLYLDDVVIVDVTDLIAVIAEANARLGSFAGQVQTNVAQAITDAQNVLANRESNEETVAEAIRLVSNALADESTATKQTLQQAIEAMQGTVGRAVSAEDGIEQTIGGLKPNTVYRLSGWARTPGTGDTAELGVRDYGGSAASVSFDGATVWTRKSLDFTTGPETVSAVVYFDKPRGAKGIYVDDVAVAELWPLAPAANKIGLIVNSGIESGDVRPWFSFGADIAASTSLRHTGAYALRAENRQSPDSGVRQYIAAGNGKTYDVSAWVRLGSGTDTAQLSIGTTVNASVYGAVSDRVVATAAVSNTGWTELTGQVTFSELSALLSASLLINTESADADLYVDDVVVKEHPLPTSPGTGDSDTDLNTALGDTDGWVFSKGGGAAQFGSGSLTLTDGNARFTGQTYRDATLSVNMRVNGTVGSWPIINIRNKGIEGYNSGYVFVLKMSEIELQKYEDGKTTMILFGDQYDHGTAGPSVPNAYFEYGADNLLEVGSTNTDDGVRVTLTINGHPVIDYEDTTDAIRTAGYFSINTGTAQSIRLSEVE